MPPRRMAILRLAMIRASVSAGLDGRREATDRPAGEHRRFDGALETATAETGQRPVADRVEVRKTRRRPRIDAAGDVVASGRLHIGVRKVEISLDVAAEGGAGRVRPDVWPQGPQLGAQPPVGGAAGPAVPL